MTVALAHDPVVDFDLIRDLRHMKARAAGDLADWLVHLELEGKADRTIYGYSRYIAELLRAHPDLELGDFTHVHLNELLRRTPKDSRHIVRSVYNGFFSWAANDPVIDPGTGEETGFRIPRNPVAHVPKMRQPRRRPKDIFSEAEVALLEALPAPDGPLWTLLFGTGLRRGEAIRLRRQHIDLNREQLVVYGGKGDKDRIVGLPLRVRAAVADLDLLERLQASDHFWYTRSGQFRRRRDPIGSTTFERWYKRGIETAGVRYLNPHQTRHTYGHWLRDQGLDLEERQKSMGHESSVTTERYYGRVTDLDVARRVASL